MSDPQVAQPATPEQEMFAKAVQSAQQRAVQEVQQSAQIEIQMRMAALDKAVANAYDDSAEEVTQYAAVFLKFLKTGEAVQGDTNE
jgi:hypothetical protein